MPAMSWLLLAVGLVAAVAALISVAPPRWPGAATVAAWPIGWLTSELPLHAAVVQVGLAIALVAAGGANAWPGWLGLAGLAVGLAVAYVPPRPGGRLDDHRRARPARGPRSRLPRSHRARAPRRLRSHDLVAAPGLAVARAPALGRTRAGLSYGDDRRHRLDVYRPRAEATRPRPVLVYVHGGGWVVGDKRQQGRLTVHELAAGGWLCVSINYRLSPRATFPDHLIDVKRALAWVRANIARYGGDPRFVVVAGGSAGAHLATLATLTAGDPTFQPGFEGADTAVAGCVSYYGVYDFLDRDRAFGHRAFRELLLGRLVMKRAAPPAAYAQASPIEHLARTGPATPPLLVIHGTRDSLVPVAMARSFVAAARRHHAPVAYVELPGAHHAFELFPSLRSVVVVHGVHRFCQAIYSRWRADHPEPDRWS
jgi:acetyl esterase/lipase